MTSFLAFAPGAAIDDDVCRDRNMYKMGKSDRFHDRFINPASSRQQGQLQPGTAGYTRRSA
jgi:hypothetical protein